MFQYVSADDPVQGDNTWLVDMLCHHPKFRRAEFGWDDAAAWLEANPEKARSLRETLTRVVE
jgi:hypothetical protein